MKEKRKGKQKETTQKSNQVFKRILRQKGIHSIGKY